MPKRTKSRIAAFICIALVGLTVGFFFSGLVNFALTGLRLPGAGDAPPIAATIQPGAIIESLRENERHRLLLVGIAFIVLCGSAVVLLMGRRETYESDTRMVTDAIQTPIAVGQGQHGTARWLKPNERGKVFAACTLDPRETVFAALCDAGRKDARGIDAYEEKTE